MAKDLDITGRAAKVHLKEIQLCKSKNADYNVRRKNATQLLRPMLTKIWDALEAGQTVNGYSTKIDWARNFFNPGSKYPERWVQKIIADPKEKPTSRRLYREGDVISVNGMKLKITAVPDADGGIHKTKVGSYTLTFLAEPVVEEPAKSPTTKIPASTKKKELKTHQLMTGDTRTWCGKTPGQTVKISTLVENDPTCQQCQNGKEAADKLHNVAEHTGQHDDCAECFEAQQALQAKRNAANDEWKKRVDSLIRQWRQYRLRDPKKYRAEFEKAAAKYLKKVGDYGKNGVIDGRGRMEAAIATQGVNTRIVTPEEPLSEPAKGLAAAVDGAELSWSQKVCIPGSPEREEWSKDLLRRRENPPIDPNEGDEFEGESD